MHLSVTAHPEIRHTALWAMQAHWSHVCDLHHCLVHLA